MENPFFTDENSPRLLDLMDAAVFDFLQQNGDRHHYTVVAGKSESSIVLLDNGKRSVLMNFNVILRPTD